MVSEAEGEVPRLEISCRMGSKVSRSLRAPGRVAIGSSSGCDLRVVARGVRARHLVLEWDGRKLVMVETAGPVLVAGYPVEAPFAVVHSTCLTLGEAEIRVTVPAKVKDPPKVVTVDETPTVVRGSVRVPDDTELDRPTLGSPPVHSSARPRGLLAACVSVGLLVVLWLTCALTRRPRAVCPTSAAAPSVRPRAPVPSPEHVAPAAPCASIEPHVTPTPARAAALLASGRHDAALAAYSSLAAAYPDVSVFAVIARILAREQGARRSGQGTTPEAAR